MNTPGQQTAAATLDAIDAATQQRCACGCGTPLDADGPSAWFASEACQRRWQVARRMTQAERDALVQAAEQFKARLVVILEQIRPKLEQLGQTMNLCAEHMRQLMPEQPPTDPMERALWLRRNRNTGPRPRQRAPRRIDPRRSR